MRFGTKIVDGKISVTNWESTQLSASTGRVVARTVSERCPNEKYGQRVDRRGPRLDAFTGFMIRGRSGGEVGSPSAKKPLNHPSPECFLVDLPLICSTRGGFVLAVAAVLAKNAAMPFELVARREPGPPRLSCLQKGGISTVPRGVNG